MLNGKSSQGAALAVAVALGFGLAPGVASAETSFWNGSTCVPPGTLTDPGCTTLGLRCGDDPPSTCRARPGDGPICVPDNIVLICCGGNADCPYAADGGSTGFPCNLRAGFGGPGICLDPSLDYCDEPLVARRVMDCHESPDAAPGDPPVGFDEGDCDNDGRTNYEEMNERTDHCRKPGARRAARDGSGACEELDSGCMLGDSCDVPDGSGTCQRTADGFGTICVPDDMDALYCGDGLFECPDGLIEVMDIDHGHIWCIPDICAVGTDAPAIDCVLDEDGEVVGWSEGDCDGDGIVNGDESSARLCVYDGEMDAGAMGGGDAGSADPPDGDPRFEGGGGCACRASEAPTRSHGWLALLVIGAMLWRRTR